MGPSGSGKTTLLKSLNRLHSINNGVKVSGQVIIDGEDIYHPMHLLPELRRKVKERLNQPAADLSVGQQQRLSIARAIAINPDILLCDEITSALDPISSEKVEHLLLSLKEEYTIVLVSHMLRQVKRLGDYIIFLYMGKVIEQGNMEELFNSPRNKITQQYIKGVIS